MNKIILSLITCLLLYAYSFAQVTTLTFTGKDVNELYVRLDRVIITNLTKSWQETIYYPDTVLIMGASGIEDTENASHFSLFQNVPNPFAGVSEFSMQLKEPQMVVISIYDMEGQMITEVEQSLPQGMHTFRLFLSTPQAYLLCVRAGTENASLTVINTDNAGTNRIDYVQNTNPVLWTSPLKSDKGGTDNPFSFGDEMEYIGYATINETEVESERIRQTQGASESFELLFTTPILDGQPCIGAPTLTDIDGNTYNTVRIGTQCWMKENLRTTKFANGSGIQLGTTTNSYVTYRYYPNNDENNVAVYGYLYNWKAVMGNAESSNANPSGVQGVCPAGWHVPSDAEWTQLTDYVRNVNLYLCSADADFIAKAFAASLDWNSSTGTCCVGNTLSANNATDFSALPAGYYDANYANFGNNTGLWSSTQYDASYARIRSLEYNSAEVGNINGHKSVGFSVRCIRDE